MIFVATSTITSHYICVDISDSPDYAEQYCINTYGTHLASIHNQAQNDEISSNCGDSTIGLTLTTGWMWRDGSIFNYSNWRLSTNEPTGSGACVQLYTEGWNDVPCSANAKFACNRPPTYSPTDNPSTKAPSIAPSNLPSVLPSNSPSVFPSTYSPTAKLSCQLYNYCSSSTSECNALWLYLTIKSDRNQLYHYVKHNTSSMLKLSNIIKQNIVNNVCTQRQNEVSKRIMINNTNIHPQNITNNLFQILYEIIGCIEHLCDYALYDYLHSNSSNFTSSDINDGYSNINVSITANSLFVIPKPYTVHEFISTFSIHNPISIILMTMFALVWFILLLGFFHSTYPNVFASIGFTMIDSFKINRITPFLFSTFTFCNHVNSCYSYFYAYSIYKTDITFLIIGILSLVMIITKIILNGMMVKLIENDVQNTINYNYIGIWLESYKSKLIWLIVLCGSFNSSLWMTNSNLFGLRVFSMHLSYKQLIQYRSNSYDLKLLFLTFSLLIISIFILVHIHIEKYKQNSIKWLTIISILCCVVSLIQKLLMKCSSSNKNEYDYKTTRMNIKIDVETNDKITIQKQKYLNTNIKKTLSEVLETNERNIDIVNSKNTSKGVCISFVVYNKICNNKMVNEKYKRFALQETLLQKQNNDEYNSNDYEQSNGSIHFKTTMDETWYIEKKLSGKSIKNEIRHIYSLKNIPLNISCQIYTQHTDEDSKLSQDKKHTFEYLNSK